MEGKVKFFNNEKGFGFIESEDGKDVFVHITKLEGLTTLEENQTVTFEVEQGDRGPMAVGVKLSENSEDAEESEDTEEAEE